MRVCPRKEEKSKNNVLSVSVEKAGEDEGLVQTVRNELPTTANAVGVNSAQKSADVNLLDLSGDAAASKQMGDE